MSRGELSDQGDSPTSSRCESIQVSPNFVTTCPLFNINFLRGPHSSVTPSSRSSRLSSGCYSLDTDRGQMTKSTGCDKATQTPSPTCQAIYHAQHALAQAQRSQIRERIQPSTGIQESSLSVPMDLQPEVWIGQELRRIGDDFNSHYQTGRARNHRPPNNQIRIFWHWINILFRRRINGV
ncbi:bcl-2-like protein 11 isoform X1 [Mustelus asterias]